MTTTTKMPSTRMIEGEQADFPEDYAQEIQEAVYRGIKTAGTTNGDEGGLKEVCATSIRDPRTDEPRWVVEAWEDPKPKIMRDFDNEESAQTYYAQWCDQLGI